MLRKGIRSVFANSYKLKKWDIGCLFILDLGKITVQLHPPTAAFYSHLVLQVSLIGCHGKTPVLASVFRGVSLGEKLAKSRNFPENYRMEHSIRFCLFF